MKYTYQTILTTFLFIFSPLAQAYIGPGAGLSAIGSIIAFIGAFLLIIVGFLWYPIKRFLKRRQKRSIQDDLLSKTDTEKSEQ